MTKDERLAELESDRLGAVNRERDVKAVMDSFQQSILEKDSKLTKQEQQLKLCDSLREQIHDQLAKLIAAQVQDETVSNVLNEHQTRFRQAREVLQENVSVNQIMNYVE